MRFPICSPTADLQIRARSLMSVCPSAKLHAQCRICLHLLLLCFIDEFSKPKLMMPRKRHQRPSVFPMPTTSTKLFGYPCCCFCCCRWQNGENLFKTFAVTIAVSVALCFKAIFMQQATKQLRNAT